MGCCETAAEEGGGVLLAAIPGMKKGCMWFWGMERQGGLGFTVEFLHFDRLKAWGVGIVYFGHCARSLHA